MRAGRPGQLTVGSIARRWLDPGLDRELDRENGPAGDRPVVTGAQVQAVAGRRRDFGCAAGRPDRGIEAGPDFREFEPVGIFP